MHVYFKCVCAPGICSSHISSNTLTLAHNSIVTEPKEDSDVHGGSNTIVLATPLRANMSASTQLQYTRKKMHVLVKVISENPSVTHAAE